MFELITFVLAIMAIAHFGYFFFLFLQGSEDDVECGNHSEHPTNRTPLLSSSSSPNSDSRSQANIRTPATYHHYQNSYQWNHTVIYAGHSHRASLVPAHPQPASYPQPPSSTCAQPSHMQPPGSGRIAQATAKVKPTRENARADLASPRPQEYRETPVTPTRTHVSPPRQSKASTLVPSPTHVAPLAPSRLPNVRPDIGVEAATTAEDKRAANKLRERARRCGREMCAARDLAKSAHKRRDYAAAQRHTQDAIAHDCEMKSLDRKAAEIFFRENNKVRCRPVSMRNSCSTSVVSGSCERDS
jgi:hypothetical protein